MGHKGYYGQYTGNSKFSKKQDEAYDAKEAYNKDLTASARLHYLENDRHDHNSPARQEEELSNKEKRQLKREARRTARKTEGDRDEIYYNLYSDKMEEKRKAAPQKHCMN